MNMEMVKRPEQKEAPKQLVEVRVLGNDGRLTEPFQAEIVEGGLGINAMTGKPEIKFRKVGGTSEIYKAEWMSYEDGDGKRVDGWAAYPMD